jgi:hypothetical protein
VLRPPITLQKNNKQIQGYRKNMSNTNNSQNIINSLGNVEHPAIATTLLDLGMLRDIAVTSDLKATLTMVLPFPSIPDNVRDSYLSPVFRTMCVTIW